MQKFVAAAVMAAMWCGVASLAKAEDAPALTTAEIETLITGRTLYLSDQMGMSRGNAVRMFFDSTGTVRAASSSGISNSGPYTVKDDRLCYEWADTRWGTNWCFTLKKDDDEVRFIANRGLKWIMKSSNDGNPDNL